MEDGSVSLNFDTAGTAAVDSAVTIEDAEQRRALLLHFGDVVEAIGCAVKCGGRYNTIGEAYAKEESLAGFAFLGRLDPETTPFDFAGRAASAYFPWSKLLLEPELNRQALGYTVQHDLFEGNQEGWDEYVNDLRASVPWFGDGLDKVPEAVLETSAVWPSTGEAEPDGNGAA
jgi:hypothetical protein